MPERSRGELEKKLANLTRLQAEAAEATGAVEAARAELRAAEDSDASAAVAAKVEGRSAPEHGLKGKPRPS